MYTIEVHNRIIQIFEVFHRFGLWRNEDEYNAFRKVAWKLFYFIFQLFYSISVMLAGLLTDDKNEYVYLLTVDVIILVATVRLFYILWKKEEILEFVLDIGTHTVADNKVFVKVNGKVKKLMKFSTCYLLMIYMATTFSVFCIPLFSSERSLPINIWFPLDWKHNLVYYWIAYAIILVNILIIVVIISLSVLLWYLMLNCALKYQILGNQFRNLAPVTTIKKRKISKAESNTLFEQELIGLIKSHQNIKGTIDQFNACFANLFFVQIATSGICICGSIYSSAFGINHVDPSQLMVNLIAIVYSVFDIFMVMYFGNEIKLSSDRLSYCLFESDWIDQSKSCKKCIIILTEVLKQPHELVIGKLYPLNLETFISIVDLAYSMFNILKSLK